MPSEFSLRVYWEDTDAGGVVYYANYLKFAERARTEALHSIGISQQHLREEHGLLFVVRECHALYHKPARLDDHLTIQTELKDSASARLTLTQRIRRESELLVELTVTIVSVNASFRPSRLPAPLLHQLQTLFAPTP